MLYSVFQLKIARNFNAFLRNSENKVRLISLIREALMRRRSEILQFLKTQCICISTYQLCELLDEMNINEMPELSSDQEEADTNICLHDLNALKEDPEKHIIVRSHSGDVDVNILLTSLIIDSWDKVYVDANTGKKQESIEIYCQMLYCLWKRKKLSLVSMLSQAMITYLGFLVKER